MRRDGGLRLAWALLVRPGASPSPEFDGEEFLGLSIHGFSGGVLGVVYEDRSDSDRSHFFGAHTPTSTCQAAMMRFALIDHKFRSCTRQRKKPAYRV